MTAYGSTIHNRGKRSFGNQEEDLMASLLGYVPGARLLAGSMT